MEKIELKSGQRVFSAGEKSDGMYLLVKGSIGIFLPNNDTKDPNFNIGENEIFGEMGVIENELRMADAKCMTDCTLIKVTQKEFDKKVEETDLFVRHSLFVVSSRLREVEKSLRNK